MSVAVELRHITKRFPGVVANKDVSMKVETGTVHALVGENGAGKSTVMKILYGMQHPDSGEILVNGTLVNLKNPNDAIELGIGMVHQHFMLIPVFTVAENIVLGHEKINGLGVLNLEQARSEIARISKEFNFDVDPDAVVETLPVGIQQRVEVIRALIYNAKVLILDEPTAVLTPQETDELLQVMKNLKKQGTSIIFITHKLREVKEAADRITIIRRGKVVGTALPSATQEELASQMVGRPVDLTMHKNPAKIGSDLLSISNLVVTDSAGRELLHNVSLDVRAGEIVAVAGVQGNGQTELARAILNLEEHVSGSILVDGKNIVGETVRGSLHSGVAFIPESRELDGLIGSFSIAENLILDTYDLAPNAKGLLMSPSTIKSQAEKRIAEFDIRTQSAKDSASSLSGGNKQKVVLARELSRPVKLVVASQPTRGLDVGSIEFVHERIIAERDAGRAVLLFSTELDEVSALADRIAVMYRGEFIAIVPATTSREDLGLLMAGVKP